MKKWYLFDKNCEEMCGDDWDNFDNAQYVYVPKENLIEFKKHYADMGFDAQEQVIPDKVNEWDTNDYEFVECTNCEVVEKILKFIEKEKSAKPMECAAKVGADIVVKENSILKKGNLILYFHNGNTLQTNDAPVELEEIFEAIPIILKPSILGRKVQSIQIEIV